LEETRKLKELNSVFNSRTLNQNINEIITVKQRLAQTSTELQHNVNEAIKLKEKISKVNFFKPIGI
jgi:5-methylcytosine-specific restriction endonuclease McrBC GTP-binding regulatory subunit McrB